MFRTIHENKVSSEIVDKKSKFIANLYYIKSEKEAQEIIKKTKKQYFDARHNCYAYRVMCEDNKIIERQSDDGEPSGTAGAPMLNILSKNDLCNVLVIVTRYFGGILLGTGGLVRAYSLATTEAINSATIANEMLGIRILVEVDYSNAEKLKYYIEKNNLTVFNTQYENTVKVFLDIPKEKLQEVITKNNVISFDIIENINIRV